MKTSMNSHELTGRATTHLVPAEDGASVRLHRDVARAFAEMKEAARDAAIDLSPFSGFRDFEKQSGFWNAKWRGERTLHDVAGRPVDFETLSPTELAHTILIWSALPGASRHHWGTDIDVIDLAARPPGYEVELLPYEYLEGGVFNRLHRWLEENMGRFGFFFPYRTYNGGISTEPWHISYAPVSVPALESFTLDILRQAVAGGSIEGGEVVVAMLPAIYDRYVTN